MTANNDTYPCVAFFAVLHNQDVEPEITPIKVRNRGETGSRNCSQTALSDSER